MADFNVSVDLAGSGILTTDGAAHSNAAVSIASAGTLTAAGAVRLPPSLTVSPASAELGSTPGSIIATITNGAPGDTFTVKIGSTTLLSGVLDEAGVAFEISVPVPAVGAGTYPLVFTTGGGRSAMTSLVVLADALVTSSSTTKPAPTPPTTTLTQRWRLFYLDGTLGYTFTRNPKSWTNVHPPNDFTHDNTTAPDGQILTWQAAARPWRMEFVGFVDSQAEYEAFVFWSELRRRFWLVDHRNRKWLVTFEQFDAQALIKPNRPWAHDYTMKTLVFAQG